MIQLDDNQQLIRISPYLSLWFGLLPFSEDGIAHFTPVLIRLLLCVLLTALLL